MGIRTKSSKEQLKILNFINRFIQNYTRLNRVYKSVVDEYKVWNKIEKETTMGSSTTESFVEFRFIEDNLADVAIAQRELVKSILQQADVLNTTYAQYFQHKITPAELGLVDFKVQFTGDSGKWRILDSGIGSESLFLQFICKAGDRLALLGGSNLPDGEYDVDSVSVDGPVLFFDTTQPTEGVDTSVSITLAEVS